MSTTSKVGLVAFLVAAVVATVFMIAKEVLVFAALISFFMRGVS